LSGGRLARRVLRLGRGGRRLGREVAREALVLELVHCVARQVDAVRPEGVLQLLAGVGWEAGRPLGAAELEGEEAAAAEAHARGGKDDARAGERARTERADGRFLLLPAPKLHGGRGEDAVGEEL